MSPLPSPILLRFGFEICGDVTFPTVWVRASPTTNRGAEENAFLRVTHAIQIHIVLTGTFKTSRKHSSPNPADLSDWSPVDCLVIW